MEQNSPQSEENAMADWIPEVLPFINTEKIEGTPEVPVTFEGFNWSFKADLPADVVQFRGGRLQYTSAEALDGQMPDASSSSNTAKAEDAPKIPSAFVGFNWSFKADLPTNMIKFPAGQFQYTLAEPQPSSIQPSALDLPTNSLAGPFTFRITVPNLSGPSIPPKVSRYHFDGRPPASWNDLPSEIQIQTLEHIVKYHAPVSSSTRTKYFKKLFLALQLVNKRTCDQARYIYQQNRFVLVHGLDYLGSQSTIAHHAPRFSRGMPTAFANKVLKHPHPVFCAGIKRLELHFYPQSIADRNLLADLYSFAPLFRYRAHIREVNARSGPFALVLEDNNARRIKWQTLFPSVRRLKVKFDFQRTKSHHSVITHNHTQVMHSDDDCYDAQRMAFVSMLNLFETAFPNVEMVDVEVRNLFCLGHSGYWTREEGLKKIPMPPYGCCKVGCPERIGMALEAALLRSTWEEEL